jgi:hypothetical protein
MASEARTALEKSGELKNHSWLNSEKLTSLFKDSPKELALIDRIGANGFNVSGRPKELTPNINGWVMAKTPTSAYPSGETINMSIAEGADPHWDRPVGIFGHELGHVARQEAGGIKYGLKGKDSHAVSRVPGGTPVGEDAPQRSIDEILADRFSAALTGDSMWNVNYGSGSPRGILNSDIEMLPHSGNKTRQADIQSALDRAKVMMDKSKYSKFIKKIKAAYHDTTPGLQYAVPPMAVGGAVAFQDE